MVQDPKGNPRLFTSASSFGRMITKLHLLIDPKTHDIVRPAAYAENMIVEQRRGPTRSRTSITDLIADATRRWSQPIANAVIGHIAPWRRRRRSRRTADADGEDSPLGNLIADAQKADPTRRHGRRRRSR